MSEQEENDIIIRVGNVLRRSMHKDSADFSVHFGSAEMLYKVPAADVAKYLEQAANDVGAEVIRKGEEIALLRKKS
jgi:cell division protein YceG involved in septum cleavage